VTTSPTAALVATRVRMVVGVAVAMLRGVVIRLLLSGVQCTMRIGACHFSHTSLF
jgi:hypothetical protein